MTDMNPPLANAPCFMEQQFPVAKVSMESYKERKANYSQTLTGLGKWWGRKPLVLVRATLLGLLLPASDDPEKDREIFLKLMTMDREGLLQRKSKPIAQLRLLAELANLPLGTKRRFLDPADQAQLRRLNREEKDELQRLVFERMNYAEKLEYCDRPEQIEGPSPEAWNEINTHLGTKAKNLNELVQELGEKRFGHTPRVGDAFCGGGSIPFEAARLGCEAYASDLNPVAALLTWASLNLVGGGDAVASKVRSSQEKISLAVENQVKEWGIEHNSLGWRADAYLYCVEVVDPESGWKIPLLPTLVIGKKTNTISRLIPDPVNKRYEIEILTGVSDKELKQADEMGTIRDSRVYTPDGAISTPIDAIRQGMRMWENSDIVPRENDVFQERLYCIRWIETITDKHDKPHAVKHYRAPNQEDLRREEQVKALVLERFEEWQLKGYIPSRKIEPGYNTTQPIRERGWIYWHHLFAPRQLLLLGLYLQTAFELFHLGQVESVDVLLEIGREIDTRGIGARLLRWNPHPSKEMHASIFSNQALNTLYNYCHRTRFFLDIVTYPSFQIAPTSNVLVHDARTIKQISDIWITDPPYADAVNYHELTEFFLAWYEKHIQKLFPTWYTDSKRALAVKGNDENFKQSMVVCYRRLAENMPTNGMQVVMFTHQDAAVWADLTMILWAAGLRVTAAWTIATETDSALKAGNYVQGTVLLVLRKRMASEPLFLDEVNQQVESEVRRQLDAMTRLEDDSDPNFGDSDYQLAAYAAALRVLTGQPIEEINPEKEILRPRKPGETGPVEALIRRAVKIACDHLVPRALDGELWKQLNPAERFYLKGLEVESHGEYRSGVYQELARGFGANDYTDLLESSKANETRLKSASEFGKKGLSGEGFAGSLVRQCLFAVAQVSKSEETREGLNYLKTELPDYWASREKISHILAYLAGLKNVSTVEHWHKDAASASLLLGAVRNDHV